MSRVALVHPYFRTHSATELLFAPLGIAALASQLRKRKVETRVFDCTFSQPDQIIAQIVEYAPSIVGIHSMITMSRSGFRIAEAIRRALPGTLLVAGGPLPTLYPERYGDPFDMVFRGESDIGFPDFCRDFLRVSTPGETIRPLALDRYPGLHIHHGKMWIENPPVHHTESEIADFPMPYRAAFDHAAYHQAWLDHDGSKTTSILTTLGCPFSCDFCSRPIFGNVLRRRRLDRVFEEIDEIQRLGYDSLWIADDNFTLDPAFLEAFCRRIHGSGMGWSCLSRVTGLTAATAGLMKDAGCRRVYLGLESGDPETLQLMKKRARLSDGIRAVELFREVGIETAAFFIVGYPGETIESIESTFRFALSLPLDSISFNVPFPLPGSALFERVGGIDTSKDWNTENEVAFVYDSEFDVDWLRAGINRTMAAFADKKRTRVTVRG